ncbi:hypothetical protein H2200_003254 [Cladophialophora chaetospira]|uniref:Transcription factor domain-containing protein n=1 Tax=Cladophialophora chaetospira TaxID=386627 RepID=A0AA39CM40_9EURO|nr:hypothetical protein H2200_003254 [Cladophialophora chaetospira]
MAVPADIKILVNALGSMLDHYLLCRVKHALIPILYAEQTPRWFFSITMQVLVNLVRKRNTKETYTEAVGNGLDRGIRLTLRVCTPDSGLPAPTSAQAGSLRLWIAKRERKIAESPGQYPKRKRTYQARDDDNSKRRVYSSHQQYQTITLFVSIARKTIIRLSSKSIIPWFTDRSGYVENPSHSDLLAITYNWTRLVPIETKPGIFPLVRTFLEFANQNDAFYFCSLYTSTIHASVLQHGPDGLNRLSALSLELKGKALQCLQQDINATGSSMPSDIVINVIAALAAQEPDQNALTLRRGHHQRQSPLVKAQLLDVIAYMKPEIAHVMAMYQLVERRGGIQNIKTFGVAYLVALVDLLAANSQALPPRLPMSWKYRSPFLCIERDAHACDVHTSSPLGKGFFTISPGLKAQIEPFFYLLPYISEVSAAIAGYQCRTSHDVSPAWDLNLGDIVKFANSVHYRILCLGQPESPEAPQEENVSLDIIRLAALLHSNFVIFPVGHPSGVPNILAHKLQSILQERDDTNPFVCDSELELWMLTWGAIGALQEAILLRWFVGRIGKLTRELCNNNWPKYLEILQGFLWWSYICDDYARQIWACLEHSPE